MASCPLAITIRPAVSEDANGIARIFVESAEYHALLDPERYSPPAVETISARYRERRQHPLDADGQSITLVAVLSGEIVGFIDARLERLNCGTGSSFLKAGEGIREAPHGLGREFRVLRLEIEPMDLRQQASGRLQLPVDKRRVEGPASPCRL
jgi:hypothetical protein